MVGGQIAGAARPMPAAIQPSAAAPKEGDIGSVKEEAVGLLELVQIGDHFRRGHRGRDNLWSAGGRGRLES